MSLYPNQITPEACKRLLEYRVSVYGMELGAKYLYLFFDPKNHVGCYAFLVTALERKLPYGIKVSYSLTGNTCTLEESSCRAFIPVK